MKKDKSIKVYLYSVLVILVISSLPLVITNSNSEIDGNSQSKDKIDIAYIGSSDSIFESIKFLHKNYNKDINLVKVKNADQIDEKRFKLRFTGGIETQEQILADLVKMSIGVIGYKPASSELEDAYLKLITETL